MQLHTLTTDELVHHLDAVGTTTEAELVLLDKLKSALDEISAMDASLRELSTRIATEAIAGKDNGDDA